MASLNFALILGESYWKMISNKYKQVRSVFYKWHKKLKLTSEDWTETIIMVQSVKLKVNLIWTNTVNSLHFLVASVFKNKCFSA